GQIQPLSHARGRDRYRMELAEMKLLNRIVRRLQKRLSQDQSGFTLPELLMTVVISGIIVGALASSFLVSATAVTTSKQRPNEPPAAQQASAYFLSDAANASYFSASTPPAVMAGCPDFGAGNNVALFRWTEGSGAGSVTKDVFYGTSGSPAELVRR